MEEQEWLAEQVHDFVHWVVIGQENIHRPINVSDVLQAMQTYIHKVGVGESNVELH